MVVVAGGVGGGVVVVLDHHVLFHRNLAVVHCALLCDHPVVVAVALLGSLSKTQFTFCCRSSFSIILSSI